MAVIPEIQRQRLASSLTGRVAPQDTSVSDSLRLIGNVSGQIADALIAKKAKEQERLLELKQKTDAIESNRHKVRFDGNLFNIQNDSTLTAEQKETASQELFDETTNAIESDNVKLLFGQTASKELIAFNQRVRKQDAENTILKVRDDVDQTIDSVGSQISQTASNANLSIGDKLAFYQDSVGRLGDFVTEARGVLGPEQGAELARNSAKMAAAAMVSGLIDSDPGQVENFIKENIEGTGVFSPDEVREIRKNAREAVKEKRSLQKTIQQENQYSVQDTLLKQATEGKFPNEIEMQKAELAGVPKEFIKSLRGLKNSATQNVFLNDNPETLVGLTELLSDIPRDSKGNIKKTAALAHVLNLHQKTLEALESKTITKASATKLLNLTSPALNSGIDAMLSKLDDTSTGWSAVDFWFTTIEDQAPDFFLGARVASRQVMLQELDRAEASDINQVTGKKRAPGSSLSRPELLKVVNDVKNLVQIELNPVAEQLQIGQVFRDPTDGVWKRVVGRDADGNLEAEDDLSVPVDPQPKIQNFDK